MKYFAQEQKTWDEQSRQKLVSGVHCDVGNIITEFLAMKAACNKMDEINFCQYVQFFHPLLSGECVGDQLLIHLVRQIATVEQLIICRHFLLQIIFCVFRIQQLPQPKHS